MRPLSRKHVSKHHSTRQFSHKAAKTKAVNLPINMPMRGGYRL